MANEQDSEIDKKISSIYSKIQQSTNKALTEEIQKELAKIIDVVQRIQTILTKKKGKSLFKRLIPFWDFNSQNDNENLQNNQETRNQQLQLKLELLSLAVDQILQEKPNIIFATNIRRNLSLLISQYENPFTSRITNFYKRINYISSTPNKVLIGLALALPFYASLITIPILNRNWIVKNLYPPTAEETIQKSYEEIIGLIVLVGFAGTLGSCISILTRINEYASIEYENAFLPVVIGACKPIIGASLGILVFTLTSSSILPIDIQDADQSGKKQYFFYSIGFLIGFSERFANDIVSRAENAIAGDKNSDKDG